MKQLTITEVEGLLGRSLTSVESDNFDVYISIAESKVEDLICIKLDPLLEELGTSEIPNDLKLVIARFFGNISVENNVELGVQSKKVEDFSISYDTNNSPESALIAQNRTTLAKYSHCGSVEHGQTLNQDPRYYHDDGFYSI